MIKNIVYFLLLSLLFLSCEPDFNRDGGTRLVVEADISSLLKEHMKVADSTLLALLEEAKTEVQQKDNDLLDVFFSKLDKAGKMVPGSYFDTGEQRARTGKECSRFFHELLNIKMDRIAVILAQRLDLFGVKPNVMRDIKSKHRIIVEVPGNSDPKRLRALLQSNANLEFWETYNSFEMYPLLEKANEKLIHILPMDESVDSIARKYPLFRLLQPPVTYDERGQQRLSEAALIGNAKAKDTAQINKLLSQKEIRSLFGNRTHFLWLNKAVEQTGNCELYAVKADPKGKASMHGEMITEAHADYSMTDGLPNISLNMDALAALKWQKLTKLNIGKYIAIVLDDKVYSCPRVNSEIQGGRSMITGNFTKEEAEDLAAILKSGYLPIPLRIILVKQVSPN